jgi:hypothetical protein
MYTALSAAFPAVVASTITTRRSTLDRIRTTHPRFSMVVIVFDIVGMLAEWISESSLKLRGFRATRPSTWT